MRGPFNFARCVSRLLAGAIAASFPHAVSSQTPPCKQKVEPVSGSMGYKDRGYGCEGFIVQPQANLNIQVLSLIQGPMSLDSSETVLIGVPQLPDSLSSHGLTVFGLGLTSGLNWTLDGSARSNDPMKWQLSAVVKGAGLSAANLGLVGRTFSTARFATPWHVAVRVARAADSLRVNEKHTTANTELVVRVPAASALQYWDDSTSSWTNARAMDGDGRFKSVLPQRWRRGHEVRIRWRPRGSNNFGDVETLRLWLW